MTRLTDDQLNAIKDRHSVAALAGEWVTLRRKGRAGKFIGPCPICSRDSQSKSAGRFECDAYKWMCAVCQDGGDVIALVMRVEGIKDFSAAIERLGGRAEIEITPEIAERRGLQDHGAGKSINAHPSYSGAILAAWEKGWRKGEARERYEVFARERERKRLWAFWKGAIPLVRSRALQAYFAGRGLEVPPGARVGWHPAMPYFADGREVEPLLIHSGPAMLAPILDANGRFAGLHTTWLDPRGPKGKAQIFHPETGEALPSKKVRGSKAGGYIDLGGAREASRMIAGEGIETVAAVHTALRRAGRDLSRTMFRSGVDLGNLGGRSTATLAHPTLKTETGRPQRVPGPDPDMSKPAMPVPDAIADLILLGDGDSDPFLTGHAMERARRRAIAARGDRTVRIRFAAPGKDFNDMLNSGAAA